MLPTVARSSDQRLNHSAMELLLCALVLQCSQYLYTPSLPLIHYWLILPYGFPFPRQHQNTLPSKRNATLAWVDSLAPKAGQWPQGGKQLLGKTRPTDRLTDRPLTPDLLQSGSPRTKCCISFGGECRQIKQLIRTLKRTLFTRHVLGPKIPILHMHLAQERDP